MVNFKLRTIPFFLFCCLFYSRDNSFLLKLKADKNNSISIRLNGMTQKKEFCYTEQQISDVNLKLKHELSIIQRMTKHTIRLFSEDNSLTEP